MPGRPGERRDILASAGGCCRPREPAATRRGRAAGWPRRGQATLADRDRLPAVAHLQRNGAIPVARLAQLELLAKRAEAAQRDLEHVLARRNRRQLEAPEASVVARRRLLVGIHERHLHARQHAPGDIVDRSRERRRTSLPRAKSGDGQRDHQKYDAERGHRAPGRRPAVESRIQHGGQFSSPALTGEPSAQPMPTWHPAGGTA